MRTPGANSSVPNTSLPQSIGTRCIANSSRCEQSVHGVVDRRLDGSAHLVLEVGVALLRPDEQLFEAMLKGWRRRQLAHNLGFATRA
jgi:hypothetical protein